MSKEFVQVSKKKMNSLERERKNRLLVEEGVKNDSTPVLREVPFKKGDLTPVQVPGTPRPANAQAVVAGGPRAGRQVCGA